MSITVFRIGLAVAQTVVDQAYGSALASGRWHSLRTGAASRRVIYCAGTRALAQLEKRVHANGIAPVGQALFRLELPDGLVVSTALAAGLPDNWRDSEAVTQAFGDRWLDTCAELALWVPSYVEPAEHNLLINALHPRLSEVELVKERDPFEFDPRLA
ncbi:MAG: RES family NAD+ phosphorylase [Burkholderiales bacterium]|nr:RES family NAD+ phosphorylase [Burkholderiales bacterium]